MTEVTGNDDRASSAGLQPGARVGKYEILGRIGAGGQAIVYKGYDALLDRHVGIKQISSHLAGDPRFLERFRKEAQILARLGGANSNIVGVHELVEDETGLYMVMEFVSGHPLKAVLDHQEHAIPVEAALEILWHIAKGLRAAHGGGIVHRDIKPANILVCRDYTAKITDFGVAAQSGEDDSMTLGTTKYMAPELFGSAKVDARSDIYSLGFVAYEMLTGRSFFRNLFADVVRDPHSENLRWMKWHADSTTSVPALAEINPKVPHAVSNVVAKMMAKDLSQRYGRIEEAMEDLRKAVGGLGRKGGRDGAVAAAMAQVDQASGGRSGGADGSMSLPVVAVEDEYPTDAIPKPRMSPRTKIIMAVAAVVFVIAAGGGVAVFFGGAEGRRQSRAKKALERGGESYKVARQAYRDGDVSIAAEEFAVAADAFGRSATELPSPEAKTGQLMSGAFAALLKGEWGEAERLLVEARGQGILTLEQEGVFSRELSVRREGLGLLAEAEAALVRAVPDVVTARARLATFGGLSGAPQDLVHRSRALREAADRADNKARFAGLMAAGDAAVKAIEAILADDVFDQSAVDRMETHKQVAQAKYDAAKGVFRDSPDPEMGLQNLGETVAYFNARMNYDKAVADQSWREQIRYLAVIFKLRPTEEGRKKLVVSRAEMDYAEGVRLLDEGDKAGAREAFKRSLEFTKLSKAEQALARLDAAESLGDLLAKTGLLMRQGKYSEVVKLLDNSPAVSVSTELAETLQDAKVEVHVEAGDVARTAKLWEDALGKYELARKAKPNDTLTARRIDTLVVVVYQERKFYHLLDQGLQLLKDKQYAQAIAKFTGAEGVALDLSIPPADRAKATTGKIDTQYAQAVANGTAAMTRGDYDGAWAYFRAAQRLKDTPEVQKLKAAAEAGRTQD